MTGARGGAHEELVAFACRLAAHPNQDLGDTTFGVNYLAGLWMQAGIDAHLFHYGTPDERTTK